VPLRLRLSVYPAQTPLLAAVARALKVAPPRHLGGHSRPFIVLGSRANLPQLAAQALPHCRLASSAPTPLGWAATLPKTFPVGSAVAAETPQQRRHWLLLLLLLEAALTLSPENPPQPLLTLRSSRLRPDFYASKVLLTAAAAELRMAPPFWAPPAEARRPEDAKCYW